MKIDGRGVYKERDRLPAIVPGIGLLVRLFSFALAGRDPQERQKDERKADCEFEVGGHKFVSGFS